MTADHAWRVERIDGQLSIVNNIPIESPPIAQSVSESEAPLMALAPELRGSLSELIQICRQALPAGDPRLDAVERAQGIVSESHRPVACRGMKP
ncbi:MAG: hypothetical protein BroJett021_34730 [Chloroflexota bacterium]|nr:MAG: hypothetical protein BroJett021_34730 [Chloroflexota bacterium]